MKPWPLGTLAVVTFAGACSLPGDRADAQPHIVLPVFASTYSSGTGLDGILGGEAASTVAELLTAKLETRGYEADPDAALAATAAWLLKSKYAGQRFADGEAIGRVARRFGYAGTIAGSAIAGLNSSQLSVRIANLVDQVPLNNSVTRYGIMAGVGDDVAFILGELELELDDFPRAPAPGSQVRFSGAVGQRYERAILFYTTPTGTVQDLPMAGRDFDLAVPFAGAGEHRVEVMGDGADGPKVLMNVPLWVGVPEEEISVQVVESDPALSSEQAEESLFFALNDSRRKAGLGPLEFDAELCSLARAHCADMAAHHFVGHVSPSTGSFDDRTKTAALRGSKFGECVALEVTPERVHAGLLHSPAHRLVMLDGYHTHAGVGVAFDTTLAGQRRLLVTLVLARRAPAEAAHQTAAQLFEAVQGFRSARNLRGLRHDPTLKAVAAAGIRALKKNPGLDPQQITAASGVELQRQVDRSGGMRSVCQLYLDIIEPYELSQLPILLRPELTAIGIGAHEMQDAKGPRLGVMLVMEPDLACE